MVGETQRFPFRHELGPGGRVEHWHLSPIEGTDYALPPEPMQGVMDARFFLAQHRNWIPHEYPCRAAFAAAQRDRPPPLLSLPSDRRGWTWWFPGGADRVDRSGFWFRPTLVTFQALSGIALDRPHALRFRLETCGAARLWAGEREIGWLAPCQRNLATEAVFEAELPEGWHALRIELVDLCERDTRLWFRLRIEPQEAARVLLDLPLPSERALHLAGLLEHMTFDRPALTQGTARIAFDRAACAAMRARIGITGDFAHGRRQTLERSLDAAARHIALVDVADLPAGFRHFEVELEEAGFALTGVLAAEVLDEAAQPPPPATLLARAEEALLHAAGIAHGGPAAALAGLATGAPGATTDALLASCLASIERCHDCADFHLVPLLWARIAWPERIDAALRVRIDKTILGFRYWLDEPGDDVMWFFSENHALLFHVAAHLAGSLFVGERFHRSGRSGAEQVAIGARRLHGWFDHFERCGMAEWNSAPYLPIDLKGLLALLVLSPDPAIRARAMAATHRLFGVIARCSHHGLHVASQGRSYEHSLRAARTAEVTSIARLLWGRGWLGAELHALPMLALAVRDHGLAPSPDLARLACWEDPRELEWCSAEGEDGFAKLYHYRTRHVAMGSIASYRAGAWGYQETVLHARIGHHPDAQLFLNHPGETLVSGFARPSFWGGNGTIPRVHQYRGLAVVAFDTHPDTPGFTHAFLPRAAFEEWHAEPLQVGARGGEGLVLLRSDAALAAIQTGPSAGLELRREGRRAMWLVRIADRNGDGSLDAFLHRMRGLVPLLSDDGWINLDDPDYGRVRFAPSGTIEAEGRVLNPASWTHDGRGWLSDGTAFKPLQTGAGAASDPREGKAP